MADKSNENSYRSILKVSSIFGGVQVLQALISVIRGKFVAMILGPVGMGINSLFNTSAMTITQFSSLGLNLAMVKEIASVKDDPEKLRRTTALIRRMVMLTALVGALVCILLSGVLSRVTFGTYGFTWQFMLLSLMIFFTISGNGLLSVLQGLHEVKRLSRASVIGGVVSIVVGVPLYYLIGAKGIVPALVAMSLSIYIFYRVTVDKVVARPEERFRWRDHTAIAKRIVAMGLLLMAGDVISTSSTYVINLFIRVSGSVENVGLYQGANSLTNQYTGMVFAAMILDYFPRLSASINNTEETNKVVNRQLEIVGLIVAPLASLLILTAPLVIRILLTSEFAVVTPLMRWLGFAILIRAIFYPMGFVILAKGHRKLYFWMEAVGMNLLTLALSCLGYYFFGLIGLGYAMVADCTITLIVYISVNRHFYGIRLDRRATRSILMALLFGGCLFAVSFFAIYEFKVISYILMSLICGASIVYSVIGLRKCLRRDKDAES